MNTYKCPQCNLTNWMNIDFCKRCKVQNPYFVPQNGANSFENQNEPVTTQQFPVYQQVPSPQQTFASPPLNSTSVRSAPFIQENYSTFNGGDYQPHYAQGYSPYQPQFQPIADPYAVSEEVILAYKQIRHASFAGFVWSVLLFIASILLNLAFKSVSSNPAVINNPGFPKQEISDLILYIGFFSVLIFGLSFGIRKGSLICGILLLLLTIYGAVSSVFELVKAGGGKVQVGAAVFSIFILFWISIGVRGLVVLKKHGY